MISKERHRKCAMYFYINKELYHLSIFMYEIEFTDQDIQL